MKIDIVSHSDLSGGAARAAYRLKDALVKNNINCKMVVKIKLSDDVNVIGETSKIKIFYLKSINYFINKLQKLQKVKSSILHSINIFGSPVYKKILISDSDIINIHWVNAETLSIRQIGQIKKPMIMTLHDMWAFCGSEHLSIDSDTSDFRNSYNYISSDSDYVSGFNFNKWTWNRKKKHWNKKFPIVTPSTWLSDCVKSSSLFNGWDVYTIPNAIDIQKFKPIEKTYARFELNLPNKRKIIGFGAMGGGSEKNKGFDLLKSALTELKNKKNYILLIFGESNPKCVSLCGIETRYLGHISNDSELVKFYNAIDVMVVPSRQEAFGQTASESLSCGTPVVAFNCTGLIDIIDNKKNGYLAKPYDSKDLCSGIEFCCNNFDKIDFKENARNKAINMWSYDIVATQYINLYKKILN
ncbi:TPA: glycosyltransferase [Photobacterium damselae]